MHIELEYIVLGDDPIEWYVVVL